MSPSSMQHQLVPSTLDCKAWMKKNGPGTAMALACSGSPARGATLRVRCPARIYHIED